MPSFSLHSPETGTAYVIQIHAPATTVREPVPAILFLDGDDQFSAAIEAYRTGYAQGSIPPLLLVGIGYGASYTKPGNHRIRDYTPTPMKTESGSGGADGFLRFLTATLWPELTRRHALQQDVRGLAGHSLGALLVVHAGFQSPVFFNRLLASAPSLWWDNRALLEIADRRQRTGAPLPIRLHLSAGTEDTESMATDLLALEQQLAARPIPELQVISERFAGRDHYNVLPDAFRAGMSALFGHAK